MIRLVTLLACIAAIPVVAETPTAGLLQSAAVWTGKRPVVGAASSTELHTITVEHVTIRSHHSFDEVRAKLESSLPRFDPHLLEGSGAGNPKEALRRMKAAPSLSIFSVRDHGHVLSLLGLHGRVLQYEIGNPLTASKMSRLRASAALYAPIRVILREDRALAVFEYDSPQTLFGQFSAPKIDAVAKDLDVELKHALTEAAS